VAPTESQASDGSAAIGTPAPSATHAASASEPPGPTDATQAGIDQEAATAVLKAASFDDPTTLDQVESVKDAPAVVSAAAALATTEPAGGPRWAVVYVLANATDSAPSLVPFLADTDITIRVMASIGAIGQGERAGFPPLIDALSHDESMSGFEPPMLAWASASLALARHTGLTLGPALDADMADREASIERWNDWWAQNASTVQFDPTTEEWAVP
jgi:hypothetical protein